MLVVVALLASCASVPPPNAAMSRAEAGLKAANEAGAADADPVDLDFAKGKFTQAQAAMTAGKYAVAANLAAESLADSRLAQTKARLAGLRSQIRKQSAENTRLRKQLLDNQPASSESTSTPASPDSQELPETVLPSPTMSSMPAAPAPASSASNAMQEGTK